MSEKMREEFDLWFASNAPQCAALALRGDKVRIAMREMAWFSWQASRQAIEIELPKIVDKEWANTHAERSAMREAIEWCKKRIESAGLRVKK